MMAPNPAFPIMEEVPQHPRPPMSNTPQPPTTTPRVLHFYPDFGAMGGIERYLLSTCQHLAQNGRFEPVVVCSGGGRLQAELIETGVRTYGVKTWQGFTRPTFRPLDILTLWQLARILHHERPDLVQVHVGSLENLWFKLLGYPVIYTFHGYSTLYSLRQTQGCLKRTVKHGLRLLYRWMAPQMERFMFVSQAERLRMEEEGYLPKDFPSQVIHNGIPFEAIRNRTKQTDRSALRASLGVQAEAPLVGFINRLDDNKDPLGFIACAENLVKQPDLSSAHFIIAGSGPLAGAVESTVASSPIAERIHVIGHRQDVPELLAICDVALFMAKMEGFGLGVLEAMAAGTLLTAYHTGGIVEILNFPGSDPFKVTVGNTAELLEKTHTLLTLPPRERTALIQRLTERAMAFDFPLFMKRLEQLYADVLASR